MNNLYKILKLVGFILSGEDIINSKIEYSYIKENIEYKLTIVDRVKFRRYKLEELNNNFRLEDRILFNISLQDSSKEYKICELFLDVFKKDIRQNKIKMLLNE